LAPRGGGTAGGRAADPYADAPLTSRSLIAAAQRGDRAAMGALLRHLQDPWYRLSLGMLHDPELAAEAVQEAGMRFLRQLPGFRGDSQLRTWSLGIAINVVRELKRRRRRMFCIGDPATDLAQAPGDDSPHASDGMERHEQQQAMRKVLCELPDRQREAVVLRFFEDLSVEETAKLMGCAAGTVKATVHQALRSLRKRLGNWM
jgi:RNA polymerase sigma-70 factor (ECF subfamily)